MFFLYLSVMSLFSFYLSVMSLFFLDLSVMSLFFFLCLQTPDRFHLPLQSEEGEIPTRRLRLEEEEGEEQYQGGSHEVEGQR